MIVGFTCGAFDLLHTGHLVMLKECKNHCDRLIVGLHSDPSIDRPKKNKPIQSIFERYGQLQSCKYVDQIVPYDTEHDLQNMMGVLDIQKRFVGSDHIKDVITGASIMAARNIKLVFTKRYHDYSTTELRERIFDEFY